MANPQKVRAWIAVVTLIGAACGFLLWAPWHGPVILSLSSTHGLDAGDLPTVVLIALAIAIGHANLPNARSTASPARQRWAAPAAAVVLGALLMVALVDSVRITTLLPTGGGTFGGAIQHADGPQPDPVDDWSHLAVTFDKRRLRLYVSGRQVSSQTTSGSIRRTSDPLWIGGNEPYGEYFNGDIDDVRIYDRALNPSELGAEMSSPQGRDGLRPRSGLVAAYEFETDPGGRATDASGEGNTGSIIGAARTPQGRFGDALRFDGAGEVVRVPRVGLLDLDDAMTVAAWVRPLEPQAGWRTIVHRQTDAYFLTAGGGGAVERLGALDGVRLAALIAATALLALALAVGGADWIGGERRLWWPPVALFVAGSLVDTALAPSDSLVGPTLVAIWLALSATVRLDAAAMWLLAAAFTTATVASLAGSVHLPGHDASIARSGAVGALLVAVGLLGARRGSPVTAR